MYRKADGFEILYIPSGTILRRASQYIILCYLLGTETTNHSFMIDSESPFHARGTIIQSASGATQLWRQSKGNALDQYLGQLLLEGGESTL